MNNICLYTIAIAFNLVFFSTSFSHVFFNFIILNRWTYLIKGLNDNKLYVLLHGIFIFHYFSRDILSEYYIYFLNNIVALLIYWKRNLLAILALNFAKEVNENPDEEKYVILKNT